MKKYLLTIPVDAWFTEVYVMIGGTNQDFNDYLEKKWGFDYCEGSDALLGECVEVTTKKKAKRIALWVKNPDLGTLIHEVLHATIGIIEYKGGGFIGNGEESFVYLHEFLVTAIIKKARPRTVFRIKS